MVESSPPLRTLNVTEARQRWSEVLTSVFRHRSRVVVEKCGIPVAAALL